MPAGTNWRARCVCDPARIDFQPCLVVGGRVEHKQIASRVIDAQMPIGSEVTSIERFLAAMAPQILAAGQAGIDIADALVIGKEKDTITHPARGSDIAIEVEQPLELTCSLCVDPQVASGPAAIALPEGWLADVATQHNSAVGAKGDGVGDAIGQPNWLTALVRDAREHTPAGRGQSSRTGVEDLRSVGLPANHFRAPGIIGQPTRRPAIRGHHIDFIRAFITTSKGNLPTIRRKPRPGGCRHASGQSFGATTIDGDTPEVILCRKDELIAIDGRKAKIAGGSHEFSFKNGLQS